MRAMGAQCRHNLNYWRFGDYLGIGAGAHGKLTLRRGRMLRTWKLQAPALVPGRGRPARRGIGGADRIAAAQLPFEFMLNALRLLDGFRSAISARAPGLMRRVEAPLDAAFARGWLECVDGRVAPHRWASASSTT